MGGMNGIYLGFENKRFFFYEEKKIKEARRMGEKREEKLRSMFVIVLVISHRVCVNKRAKFHLISKNGLNFICVSKNGHMYENLK